MTHPAKIESSFVPTEDGKAAQSLNGMVSSAFPDATKAGVRILNMGGNAIDAACATALALGVCEPQASGIGGQTMMLLFNGKKVLAIDGSSRAPSLAHVNAVYKEDRARGYRATTVPSTLATLGYVQKRYGQLAWSQIVAPSVELAEEGYCITELQHSLQKKVLKDFKSVESGSGAAYFLDNGEPYDVGKRFVQRDLANLLKRIAGGGVETFYIGKTAQQIDADMRENGGLLRYDDLSFIPWPIERKPLTRRFREYKIFTMPPSGAGRTLLFTLSMLNRLPAKRLHKDDIRKAHLLVEIFRQALLERSDRPFDSNFYPQISGSETLINAKYAVKCIKRIAKSVDPFLPIKESFDEDSGETTHLSVIDKNGNAVSLTQSIERVYGSKTAAQGLGFLYNNYLMDFEFKIPSHPFYLRPNASPWSTVAPSLVFYQNDIWIAVGSPGSERSITAIVHFLLNMDQGMNIDQAMRAPRIHCSLGGKISLEAERFRPEIIEFLKKKKYRLDLRNPYSFYMGAIHAALKKHDGTGFQGVAEVRRDGIAMGGE